MNETSAKDGVFRARAGSDLDVEDLSALIAFLQERRILPPGEKPCVRRLEGGVSNRALLIKSSSRPPFVVKQALPKLRVAVDWFSSPSRIHQEARGLEWLQELAPPGTVPPLLFEDLDSHVIGMAAVPEPNCNWKRALLNGDVNLAFVERFALILGTIHRTSSQKREKIARVFEDRSFFETLRLEPYYRYSATQVPETAAFYANLIEMTLATKLSLVHGDYSPKNVLIHDGHLFLLDHEVIHFGDPAFDVGFALCHLLSKANHLARSRAAFVEAAQTFARRYLECIHDLEWSRALEVRAARHTLGCLMARVVGRSPLEYLSPQERNTQLEVALKLVPHPPGALRDFIDAFSERLPCP